MQAKRILWGLVFIGVLLMTLDFFVNDYKRFFTWTPKTTQETEENTINSTKEFISQLPTSFLQTLPEDVLVIETSKATTLFSRLDISGLQIKEALQTPLTRESQSFGTVYEFSGSESLYFQLKSALNLILQQDDSVVDANNLGSYSLYYNDSKRPNTVFLLSIIHGRIWGFEYSREQHEIFKKLTKTLVDAK
ncbi:hypothetical protein HON22_00170 [Candidatus Peregrinibacteria bacterium]|jgi:hypothetical protein|nr:hypothetical protein [Candidatus Peregrinibacteria bacterium]